MTTPYLLTKWSLRHSIAGVDPYMAPERIKTYLNGDVYGHPNFADGTNVTTSSIVKVDNDTETVTTSSGSLYALGGVDTAYEAAYPNAYTRLMGVTRSVRSAS